MKATGYAFSMGLGIAAGMVAVLMLPRKNPARKLAAKAACDLVAGVSRFTFKFTG